MALELLKGDKCKEWYNFWDEKKTSYLYLWNSIITELTRHGLISAQACRVAKLWHISAGIIHVIVDT